MDILTHVMSGVAFGTVVSSISKTGIKNKFGLLALGGFGALLPDFDAISLWSKFDAIFGKFFGLNHSGKEIYSSKFWYSHHGFMHSIVAGLFLGLFIGILIHLVQSGFQKRTFKDFINSFKSNKFYLIAFVIGFCIHLAEDIPTPASTWGGVNLFWPFKQYIGGTGEIWWWNNYDIFLITVCVIMLNVLILIINRFVRFDVRKFTISIFVLGLISIIYQIKTRDIDFNYNGHTTKFEYFETKSRQIQKNILGDKLYNLMVGFDNKMKLNF